MTWIVTTFLFALKPSKHVYKKILKKHNYSKSEVACLGDQLMSDILGANRMGFLSIYTKPLVDKDIIYTKFSRRIEKILIKKIEKREDNE